MAWYERIRNLLFRRDEVSRRIDDEFAFHLAEKVDELMEERGLSETEARSIAQRQFGNRGIQKERARAVNLTQWLETLYQDLRYGARTLVHMPGYAATAVLSLVLGIGANTAIFSIVDAVMFRSLPIEDPSKLVQLRLNENGDDELSTPLWEQVRDRHTAFSGVLAYAADRFDLADGGERQMTSGMWVSGDFFNVLGVSPLLGRTFNGKDEQWGGSPDGAIAVISHRFWQGYFRSDPQVVGRTFRLNRRTFTVTGVTPAWFTGLDIDRAFDVAIPIGSQPILHPESKQADEKHHWWLRVLGRLGADESIQQADQRMRAIAPEIFRATLPERMTSEEDKAEHLKQRFVLKPAALGFSHLRTQYRTVLYALLATTALVLLIACANIANLMLARASARRREISVRMAIGAGRFRVIRQLMTESLLLSLFGALGGLLFARWSSKALLLMISTAQQRVELDVDLNLRVLAFTIAIAVLTTLLFGLAPAIRATGIGGEWLRTGEGNALAGPARLRVGRTLVAVQVALSFVLLIGAGLFLTTLRNLLQLNPGFDRHNLLLVTVDAEHATQSGPRRADLFRDLIARVQSIPGVTSAASSDLGPIGPEGWAQPIQPEGPAATKSPRERLVFLNRVSPGYFRTMRTAVLAGREFNEQDTATGPRVMIINELTAQTYFGTRNAVGKTIGMGKPGPPGSGTDLYEVVGVVQNSRYNRIDENQKRVAYLASTQAPEAAGAVRMEIRTARDAESMIPMVRSTLLEADRNLSVQFRSLEGQVNESLLQQRVLALLSGVFGGLALLLAMVGLYGVTSYGVAQRTKEIGLRVALGAKHGAVIWMILRELLILLTAGIALGLLAALTAGSLTQKLLYGVRPNDPAQLIASTAILIVASLLAAYLPVRRAARLDPISALRDE